jgi:hypothetical protein
MIGQGAQKALERLPCELERAPGVIQIMENTPEAHPRLIQTDLIAGPSPSSSVQGILENNACGVEITLPIHRFRESFACDQELDVIVR